MNDIEEWKDCPGYPEHEVSTFGRFRHKSRKRILHGSKCSHGYQDFQTTVNGKFTTSLAHRLVAKAFLAQPSEKHTQVNHKNKNRSDNRIVNLEWVTPSENARHSKRERKIVHGEFFKDLFNFDPKVLAGIY